VICDSVHHKELGYINLTRWLEEDDTAEHIPDELDEGTMRELRNAAIEGRQLANRKEKCHKDNEEWF
jgi:hypothetical protein